ncbi:MFS transporter [Lipingzhangella sp. LS1_29]|uniref:MFS transporter n=1 Tax=Lipingzhangella rawalii TaxID=2055835 RepID=A0ABU2H4V5_9ACTN|nr:MFS transporter [Lipingzhangella rawalii]MDS1270337.1 MFS transporter [Lipingzhangella rawalii]
MSVTDHATGRAWLGLAVLTLPLVMVATDMTVLFLALPSIAGDLSPGSTQLLWILHVGMFLAVGFALTMGRVASRLGARRLLAVGLSVYGSASLAAAFAPSPEALIAMRALLGSAEATVMPATMMLLRPMFPNARQFAVAVAVIMSSFSAGMALGPPLGGVLLEYFWWGSVFLVNVPVAALVLLALPLLPAPPAEATGRVDARSVLLSLSAIVAVIFGLQEIADIQASGGDTPIWPYLLSVASGLILGTMFVRRQLRLDDPLLDLRLFRTPGFGAALLALLLLLLGIGGTDMLLAQFLQSVRGISPGQAGLLLLIPALASVVGGMLGPVLTRWMRPAYVMSAGMAVAAAGALAVALLADRAGTGALIAGATVIALAAGPLFTLGYNMIVGAVPERHAGSAAGMADVGGGLGNALSLAFMGSMAAAIYRWGLDRSAPQGVTDSTVDRAGESIGGAVSVADQLPAPAGPALVNAARDAFTTGVQAGYAFAALLLLAVAVLVAVRLRHIALDDRTHNGASQDDTSQEETNTVPDDEHGDATEYPAAPAPSAVQHPTPA